MERIRSNALGSPGCYLIFPGWYMAVESNRGDQMSPATMQSPTMTQASAACTLHFYYNMFGEGMYASVCVQPLKCSCSLHM